MQVLPLRFGSKDTQFDTEFLLEIVADIANDFLFGCGSETGNCYRLGLLFLLLQLTDKIADVEVVGAEVLSPGGEAVCLINHKPHHITAHKQPLYRIAAEHFRGNV